MPAEIKAVLVNLKIRIFPNTRQDPAITEEVRLRKAIGVGAGKWVKHLFPQEAFAEIRKIGSAARQRHYDMTMPWEDGLRLLSASAQGSYDDQMEDYIKMFLSHVAEFGKKYDEWVAKSEIMHGKTFDADAYPDWHKMERHFTLSKEYFPVPKAAHFITEGLAKDAVQEMREELNTRNAARVQEAVNDTWNRVLTPVQALADKLVGEAPIFRNTLIENVNEIVNLVPVLNVTNDAALERVVNEIHDKFANIDPDILRGCGEHAIAMRKVVVQSAKELASRFGQIGNRKFA